MNKKILIAGGTGKTGRIIVQKLLDRGDTPRILVRDQALAENLFMGAVEIYPGDVRQIQSLLPAMDGIHTVISAIGSRTPVGTNCPKRVDYQGIANLVEVAIKKGVARFILISSIAVTRPNHPMNCFGRVLEWKLNGENYLRKSGLDYAVIRPGDLTDVPGGHKDLILQQGDQIMGTISRSDLAETCLFAAEYPRELHITFEVVESAIKGKQNWEGIFSSLVKDAS